MLAEPADLCIGRHDTRETHPGGVLQVEQRAEKRKSAQVEYGSCLLRICGQHCKQVSSHNPAVPA